MGYKIDIKSNKLGDVFIHGMNNEIELFCQQGYRERINDVSYFYTSITYMILNRIIRNKTINGICLQLLFADIYGTKIEKVKDSIFELISDDVQKKENIIFNEAEELIKALNEYEIPEWYFSFGYDLFNKIADEGMFVDDGYLYYIIYEGNRYAFVKKCIDSLEIERSLDNQYMIEEIGYGFSFISSYDYVRKKVYLKRINQKDFFYIYDLTTNDYRFYPHSLYIIYDGIPYVITQDKYFAYIDGDVIHKIKEYYSYENYIFINDYIFVAPKKIFKRFFYPYCVTMDGKKIDAGLDFASEHLWKFIVDIIGITDKSDDCLLDEKIDSLFLDIPRPKKITINFFIELFKRFDSKFEDKTKIENLLIFYDICKKLSEIINPDDDITKLLYVLIDVNRIISDEEDDFFPVSKLFSRIEEIRLVKEKTDEFYKAYNDGDYDAVRNVLLDDIEVDEEKISKKNSKQMREGIINSSRNSKGKIGIFKFQNNRIKKNVIDKNEGTVIGNLVIPYLKGVEYDGFISYDSYSDIYEITINQSISESQKKRIIMGYDLAGCDYMFVVR